MPRSSMGRHCFVKHILVLYTHGRHTLIYTHMHVCVTGSWCNVHFSSRSAVRKVESHCSKCCACLNTFCAVNKCVRLVHCHPHFIAEELGFREVMFPQVAKGRPGIWSNAHIFTILLSFLSRQGHGWLWGWSELIEVKGLAQCCGHSRCLINVRGRTCNCSFSFNHTSWPVGSQGFESLWPRYPWSRVGASRAKKRPPHL